MRYWVLILFLFSFNSMATTHVHWQVVEYLQGLLQRKHYPEGCQQWIDKTKAKYPNSYGRIHSCSDHSLGWQVNLDIVIPVNVCPDGSVPVYPNTECKPKKSCEDKAGQKEKGTTTGPEGKDGALVCGSGSCQVRLKADMCFGLDTDNPQCTYEGIFTGKQCGGSNPDPNPDKPKPNPDPDKPKPNPDPDKPGGGGEGGGDDGGGVDPNPDKPKPNPDPDKPGGGNGDGGGGGGGDNECTPEQEAAGECSSDGGMMVNACKEFKCDGDPMLCYLSKREWEKHCSIMKFLDKGGDADKSIDGTKKFIEENKPEMLELGELSAESLMGKYRGGNGFTLHGSCPPPRTYSVLGASFSIDYKPFCDLSGILMFFLVSFSLVGSSLLIAKYI